MTIRSHQLERRSSARGPRISVTVPIGTATSNVRPTSTPKNSRRRDADDREGHALDRQRSADRVGGAAEAPLPEGVADDRDRPRPDRRRADRPRR